MKNLIKKAEAAEKIAGELKELGWDTLIGKISEIADERNDKSFRGYTVSVLVKIGDPRLNWEQYQRNPVIDFFAMANIASGQAQALGQRPKEFNWALAGVDVLALSPNQDEPYRKFIGRLMESAKAAQEHAATVAVESARAPAPVEGLPVPREMLRVQATLDLGDMLDPDAKPDGKPATVTRAVHHQRKQDSALTAPVQLGLLDGLLDDDVPAPVPASRQRVGMRM